ncbi:MAG TPA: HNH endonuclease signature motif containing protein, partial [Acidimicrobiia bacterium]
LKKLAKKLKRQGDHRTIDQLMADLFLDQLLGSGEAGEKDPGSVELRVDLETLAGLSEAPGELLGMGPVIADIARQVTREQRHCPWTFAVTDPETGMPVHTGVTRRRPNRETRRLVEARNPSCVFPGCRRPSSDCDLDHRLAWAERGPSCECNLVPLCRRHHRCRHRLGWRHSPLPRGDHLWISPLGHRYTTSGRPP